MDILLFIITISYFSSQVSSYFIKSQLKFNSFKIIYFKKHIRIKFKNKKQEITNINPNEIIRLNNITDQDEANNETIIIKFIKSKNNNNKKKKQKSTRKISKKESNKQINKKSLMFLLVSLLLFLAELPQAILMLISIFSQQFYLTIFRPLNDMLDVLVLLTFPINFLIYCSMSKIFRKQFCNFFSQ